LLMACGRHTRIE